MPRDFKLRNKPIYEEVLNRNVTKEKQKTNFKEYFTEKKNKENKRMKDKLSIYNYRVKGYANTCVRGKDEIICDKRRDKEELLAAEGSV